MKQLTAVLIGAGLRGQIYTSYMKDSRFKVIAVAEPLTERREFIKKEHNIPEDMCFADWKELLALPKLADILNITIEELIAAKPQKTNDHKKVDFFIDLILKSIPLAMGVAVIITSILNELSIQSGFTMLGIGVFCISLYLLKNKN